MTERHYGEVDLRIYGTRSEMGKAAAAEAGMVMRGMLAAKDEISCIFAAAPSQNEFLAALIEEEGIDWSRVNAYHMDEYVGLGLEDKPVRWIVDDCEKFIRRELRRGRAMKVLP